MQAEGRSQVAAPGSVLVIRDETWLVTRVERATDGWFYDVQGLSELVRDTVATFSTALDDIQTLDPAQAAVVADDSPGYRRTRLWLDATLRKTAVPLTDPRLTVATQGLADSLPYQLNAVRKALDPENIRPRILLADAVGLGKTLEIGMILAELVRRGRGERILVVTPRHVLEQMQFELWTRFALPFVRLDSVGIQRIRQKLPANRNPFAYFKRAIVSIDTLKSDRYIAHLEKQHWDAVVIDESHNVTNSAAQTNRLARLLSQKSDALILASATPHNGKAESFAELIRMLEPSAVRPDGTLVEEEVARLIIRRHRHSPDVAEAVGGDWAERHEPRNVLVAANAIENEIVDELVDTWLYPESGRSLYAGSNANAKLFPWTLAKAFLSSPMAFESTVSDRIKRLEADSNVDKRREIDGLRVLFELSRRQAEEGSAKYDALLEHLRAIGIARSSPERVVIFAERVATLSWLQGKLSQDLKLKDDQVVVLHGGISDEEQQNIVESFKLETSAIRVLVTGDVASEGVNLHLQCHQLVHYDIPWSLIRIEQRNGRIDRYGQKHRPVITTLLLDPTSDAFAGDVRVLKRLVEKEHEAHKALGDSASLMGKYDVAAEEEAIRGVLAGEKELDDIVRTPDEVVAAQDHDGMMARLLALSAQAPAAGHDSVDATAGIYADDLSFLRDALEEALLTPGAAPPNGVGWLEHKAQAIVELQPPADLRQRLDVLPQTYLRDRHVGEKLKLATTVTRGKQELDNARAADGTSWPEAHYLSPLHPALEWAADRALATLGRNQVYVVEGAGDEPTMLLHGMLTNARGQVVASTFVVATLDDLRFPTTDVFESAPTALAAMGFTVDSVNRGALPDPARFEHLVEPGVRSARARLSVVVATAEDATRERVSRWSERVHQWDVDAGELIQRAEVRERRLRVEEERAIAAGMLPDQQLVRPLLLVVPAEAKDA